MRILIVDDDLLSSKFTAYIISEIGYRVSIAYDAATALRVIEEEEPDLILLDAWTPSFDGFELCRMIRQRFEIPLIFISARNEVGDKVRGLQLGADDYLCKPYEPAELLARIEAVMRRSQSDLLTPASRLSICGFTLDPVYHRVVLPDLTERDLTPIEFRLLYYMMQNAGRILTPDQILSKVWGIDYEGDSNLVAVYMRRLRAKIESSPDQPGWILTVRNLGYKFDYSGQKDRGAVDSLLSHERGR